MKNKLLDVTNDYVFKRIFGRTGNEDITRSFLKAVTGIEFNKINLEDTPILERDLIENKMGILDVKIVADYINNIDIEMQVVKSEYIADRILWYWAKMYTNTIKAGEGYDSTKRAICILIADFKLENLKEIEEYYTRWQIREENYKEKILTDKLDIVIIELDKLDKKAENIELTNWCKFIKNPEKAEESIMSEYIKKAKDELDKISQDQRERRLAELREKAVRDEKAIRDSGFLEGRATGLKEGIQEEKINIAREMLKENLSVDLISKVTGLATKEIEKLNKVSN